MSLLDGYPLNGYDPKPTKASKPKPVKRRQAEARAALFVLDAMIRNLTRRPVPSVANFEENPPPAGQWMEPGDFRDPMEVISTNG